MKKDGGGKEELERIRRTLTLGNINTPPTEREREGERERQRDRESGGRSERHYSRGGSETIIFRFEDSQALPASPSVKGEA
jgi:hypothetical protein